MPHRMRKDVRQRFHDTVPENLRPRDFDELCEKACTIFEPKDVRLSLERAVPHARSAGLISYKLRQAAEGMLT